MKSLLSVIALAGLVASVSANFCFVCSTRDDTACLNPEGTLLMRDCVGENNNTCFTRIVNREVERGCLATLTVADISSCNSDTVCELCHDVPNQGRCNGAIFPEHRLQCHQCSGTTNDTCGQEITSPARLCRFFDVQDQCFVRVVGDRVERGCLSESDACRTEQQNCHLCDGHGCNFRHYDDAAMSIMVSVKTLAMALLAAVAYGSFRQ